MLNMQDAQRAMELVRATYSAQYPKLLDANGCDEVFEFLDLPQFTTKFELTYNACFKQANGFTESASSFVGGVNAFVASDYRNFRRKIYVKNLGTLKWGTLVHEYIHYLTHRYLYPTCYERGGRWPDLIEGITEYLTRTTSDEVAKIRTSYEILYRQVDSFVSGDPSKRLAVMQCCFAGETWKLGALFPPN
ncbi:MAG TPA: hypothetical protein VMB34_08425 [Acetobacteraceae bacterium]|nr:hypothetical protein [Acetobacteraceae bacterium]